jgi:hypothetical protein
MNALLTLAAVLVLVFCGRAAWNYWRNRPLRAAARAEAGRRQALKTTGRRLPVTLDNCDIHDGSYAEVTAHSNLYSYDMSAPVVAYAERNMARQVNHLSCYIIFHEGDNTYVSPALEQESENIRFLVLDGHVSVYVDPADAKNYCFDVQA